MGSNYLKLAALSGVPFIMVLGNSMLIPVFPQMKAALGLTQFQVGLTISLFSIPAGLAIPFLGFLSDRIGRKWIIVPAVILYGLGGLISGLAPVFLGRNAYWLLLVGRVVQGIGAAGTAPIAMALVSDIFKGQERSKALGNIEASNGFGKVVSPILGALLGLIVWYALFFVYAALAIPIALAVWFIIKEPKRKMAAKKAGAYFKDQAKLFKKKGISILAVYFAGSVVLLILFGILSFLSDFLEARYNLKGVMKGFALAVPVLAMSITSLLTGNWLQKNRQYIKVVVSTGLALVAVSLGLNFLIKSEIYFFISLFISGIGTGLVLPAANTMITSSAPTAERGGVTALYGSVRFFGVAAGPPLFSILEKLGRPWMTLIAGGMALAAFGISFLTEKQKMLEESGDGQGSPAQPKKKKGQKKRRLAPVPARKK